MRDQYRVKGSSIRTKFQFVRERFGEDAEKSLRSQFEKRLFPILDSSWYPFDFNEQVNRTIIERFLGGDPVRLREVGRFSAEKVLTSVYKLFATGKGFLDFLKRAEMLHQSCYSQGGMTVSVGAEGRSCTIRLSAPVFTEADMHVAAGFYLGVGQFFGEQNVTCQSTLEDGGAAFAMSWGG